MYIASIGLGIPSNNVPQNEVKEFVSTLFSQDRRVQRYLSVFDHAKIMERQFVCSMNWYKNQLTFSETNAIYMKEAVRLSLEAVDTCMERWAKSNHEQKSIPYEAIDLIAFVSSTGIATPSLDTAIMNARPFREDVIRMPLWGLGCAGGAMGLARATEWLQTNPDKTALVICCELCSLTFQHNDMSTSNIVGTALFGDGVAATLLVGQESKYTSYLNKRSLTIQRAASLTKKNTTDIMGWHLGESGLEVIFSKKIPSLIDSLWKGHLREFLQANSISQEEVDAFIAHPGGRKVLEAMEESCSIPSHKLAYSYDVLKHHGNMSSATVIYVLEKWLFDDHTKTSSHNNGILNALGPGFSSELLWLKWVER